MTKSRRPGADKACLRNFGGGDELIVARDRRFAGVRLGFNFKGAHATKVGPAGGERNPSTGQPCSGDRIGAADERTPTSTSHAAG